MVDSSPSGNPQPDLAKIIEVLSVSYNDQGVAVWLASPNRDLDGEIPVDCLTNGYFAEVLECAERIEGGM